jgi:hypothetical protein
MPHQVCADRGSCSRELFTECEHLLRSSGALVFLFCDMRRTDLLALSAEPPSTCQAHVSGQSGAAAQLLQYVIAFARALLEALMIDHSN